jgi:co-chaperonin GroES (HSP10)
MSKVNVGIGDGTLRFVTVCPETKSDIRSGPPAVASEPSLQAAGDERPSMNIRLLPGTLLVVLDPPTTRSPGGIEFPDVEHVHARTAYVLLHEPGGVIDENLTRRRIIFHKWSERDFQWGGTTLTVLREPAVLAVFEGE